MTVTEHFIGINIVYGYTCVEFEDGTKFSNDIGMSEKNKYGGQTRNTV